jgi:hypothetical protein
MTFADGEGEPDGRKNGRETGNQQIMAPPLFRAVFVWALRTLEMYRVYMNECRVASSTFTLNFDICSLLEFQVVPI